MTEFKIGDYVEVTDRSYLHCSSPGSFVGITGEIIHIDKHYNDRNLDIIKIGPSAQGFFRFRLELLDQLAINWRVRDA